MKRSSTGQRILDRLGPILVLLVAMGFALILWAIVRYLLDPRGEFWNDLLLHLGTGLLVGAFLLYLDRRFTDALQKVQDALSARVERTLVDRASFERARAAEFAEKGEYRPLHDLLLTAEALGAISRIGVRIPIESTGIYLRASFADSREPPAPQPSAAPEREPIALFLETGDRRQIVRYDWPGDASPADVLLILHDRVAQAGFTIPRSRFVEAATRTRQELASTLLTAILSRSGDDQDLKPIGRIFQKGVRNWYITSRGLENVRTGEVVSVEDLRRGQVVVTDHDEVGNQDWERLIAEAREAWRADELAVPFW